MKFSSHLALLLLPIGSLAAFVEIQKNAPWNLNAISAPQTHLNSAKKYEKTSKYEFIYDEDATGEGTYAYVIDSGIWVEHPDFEGRAQNLWTSELTSEGEFDYRDPDGHGTHVAGTIASRTFGVAKKANILNLRVTNDTGHSTSNKIIRALNKAFMDIMANNRRGKALISISMGSECESMAMTHMMNQILIKGIPIIAAAGNDGKETASSCMAPKSGAIFIGNMDRYWSVARSSNWGSRVDYFAPGSDIWSLNNKKANKASMKTGTSMAAPLVSGTVLSWMTKKSMTTFAVMSELDKFVTKDQMIGDMLNSPNKVVHNGNSFRQYKASCFYCSRD